VRRVFNAEDAEFGHEEAEELSVLRTAYRRWWELVGGNEVGRSTVGGATGRVGPGTVRKMGLLG
jgi:hypothetical protein